MGGLGPGRGGDGDTDCHKNQCVLLSHTTQQKPPFVLSAGADRLAQWGSTDIPLLWELRFPYPDEDRKVVLYTHNPHAILSWPCPLFSPSEDLSSNANIESWVNFFLYFRPLECNDCRIQALYFPQSTLTYATMH